jgi:phage portal protein BeeE
MKILGFNVQISRAKAPAMVRKSFDPSAWLRGDDLAGPMLANAYEQVVWVYRAINALAEQVANVPFLFSVGERGQEHLVTSGPLPDFYARPHPQINRFQYWELRVMWLMLRGECVRVPLYQDATGALGLRAGRATGPGGAPLRQVLLLDPARFQHIIEDHQLMGWRYTGFGPEAPLASQVFLPEEIWFEKLPNPFNFWRGLAPLTAAALAAQTDFAAGAFMRGIIENNGDTGVMVRTQDWLSDEQQEQLLAALRQRKSRAGQADRPVLLLGSTEVIRPQLSSSDLQFLENRKFSRSEICAAFGVPEEIITTTEYAKYDVMTGARLNFIENRIAPLCSRLEAEEAPTVHALDAQASGWFDLDSLPILQEARRSRLTAARTGFEMGIPFNDLNRVLDLGFKPLPWGDRGYLAGKLQEVGRSAEVSRGAEGPATRSPAASRRPRADAAVDKAGASEDPVVRAANLLGLRQAPTRVNSDTTQAAPEQPGTPNPTPELAFPGAAESKLRRFFFEQRGRALARLGESQLSPGATLLDPKSEAELLAARLGAPVPEAALAALVRMNERVLADLHRTVEEGLAAQETAPQLLARIKALYNQAKIL